ncbi:MAG: phosphoribosylanthranilate isomerase [Anaerolineae bacterium]|jgi:phosphoribosylanthranilate isomerase
MTKIKITGVTTIEDAELVAAAGVDLVGIVFFAESARYVNAETAWAIRDALPSTIQLVGVFVDTPTPLVQRVIDQCRLDSAMLFGSEPRAAVESIRPHAFKAMTVESSVEVSAATRAYLGRRHGSGAPALMLHLAGEISTDWGVIARTTDRARVLLAGDELDADAVSEALRVAHPWGVDAWETVEREPGVLEPGRLADFVAAVREADERGGTSGR